MEPNYQDLLVGNAVKNDETPVTNKLLTNDVKNILLAVSITAIGYFFIEAGKELLSLAQKNGIDAAELIKKS